MAFDFLRAWAGPPTSKIDYNVVPPRTSEIDRDSVLIDTPPPERSETPRGDGGEKTVGNSGLDDVEARRGESHAKGKVEDSTGSDEPSGGRSNTGVHVGMEGEGGSRAEGGEERKVESRAGINTGDSAERKAWAEAADEVEAEAKTSAEAGADRSVHKEMSKGTPMDELSDQQNQPVVELDKKNIPEAGLVSEANSNDQTTGESNVENETVAGAGVSRQGHSPTNVQTTASSNAKDAAKSTAHIDGNDTAKSTNDPPFYEYRRLKSDGHFRILSIDPAWWQQPIRCSLREYEIDSEDCPTYTAISYTWGTDKPNPLFDVRIVDENRTDEISPGRNILVRNNLYWLLQGLRDRRHTRRVWIDALCIDQSSLPERSQQVKLMGKIYTNANYVVAWLGSHGDSDKMREAFRFMEVASSGSGNDRVARYCNRTRPAYIDEPYSMRWPTGQEEWTALATFCKHSYWSRKWIIQEVIQAPTVVVQVGDLSFPMRIVEEFFSQFTGNPFPDPESESFPEDADVDKQNHDRHKEWEKEYGSLKLTQTPCARIATHRLARRQAVAIPLALHELLPRYRQNKCLMPSDHVYALYNMIGEHRTHLAVDYSQEPVERLQVVLEFTKDYDEIPPIDCLGYTALLLTLLEIKMDTLLKHTEWRSSTMLVTVFDLGEAQPAEESEASQELRQRGLQTLAWTSAFPLVKVDTHWASSEEAKGTQNADSGPIGPHDRAHFTVTGTKLFGLSSRRVLSGDRVWLVSHTSLAFIVRMKDEGNAMVVGRATLYTVRKYVVHDRFVLQGGDLPFHRDSAEAVAAARNMVLPMRDLVLLAAWAGAVS